MDIKLSRDQELLYLRDRCLSIIRFVRKATGEELMDQLEQIVIETYSKGNMRGMRMVSRDVNAMAKSLQHVDVLELEKMLAQQFGEDLQGDRTTLRTVRKVLERGIIESVESYRTVHEYLQDILPEDPYFARIDELHRLLNSYRGDVSADCQ